MEAYEQVACNYAWTNLVYISASYLNICELFLFPVFKKKILHRSAVNHFHVAQEKCKGTLPERNGQQ